MNVPFGIDLGTTNSVISRLKEGRPIPVPIDGSPIVPSVVLFGPQGIRVGREAHNLEFEYPDRTLRSVKRKMGTPHRFNLDGVEISPEEVSSKILEALKKGAEQATGEEVRDVVITVPAYFDDAQRRATLRAGELAGLHVLRLLNEPTSASLVYDCALPASGSQGPEIVLIYDLGGGTFDVSVLEIFQGVREVRATTGNTHLGGDDFDELLVRLFLDEIKQRHAIDPREDPRAMARLRRLAETTKINLSADTAVHIREEFLTLSKGKPIHLDLEVTRRAFEELLRPLLNTTLDLTRKAISDARLEGQSLSRICLVGGSTRIPLVRALLEETFNVDVHEEIDPDLAVGLGAAVQAGMLAGAPVDRILVDVATHSLGILIFDEEDELRAAPDTFSPVLRRHTALPAVRTKEYYTLVPEQESIEVKVFQGESSRASENKRIGTFHFPLEPKPENSPIRMEFAYDLNGVVKVSVSQPGTSNAKTVALSVADASTREQKENESSPVERKARALLQRMAPPAKIELEKLLSEWESGSGVARERIEEKLLDFFLTHEA